MHDYLICTRCIDANDQLIHNLCGVYVKLIGIGTKANKEFEIFPIHVVYTLIHVYVKYTTHYTTHLNLQCTSTQHSSWLLRKFQNRQDKVCVR